jgi:cytochrome b subunit of formate dehydrogenase
MLVLDRVRGSLRTAPSVGAITCLLALFGLWGCASSESSTDRPGPSPSALPAPKPAPDRQRIVAAMGGSVHAELDCTDCHIAAPPDTGAAPETRCHQCHEAEAQAHAGSVHGRALKNGNAAAARCPDCHGDHDIVSVNDPKSPVYSRNVPATCGRCHQNPDLARRLGIRKPEAAGQYLESIHGRALVGLGLVRAPSCVDCHGHSHEILPAADARSTVSRGRLARTCGQCHEGTQEEYGRSVHGRAAARGNPRAPICADCHTAHQIAGPTKQFKLASDVLCGKCHQDRLERYWTTYHGKAHDLGDSRVAACFDCHGKHDILPVADPASKLSAGRRLETCRKCHPGAPPRFAGYLAHADQEDREHYPALYWAYFGMTGLLLGTFGFFGVHTILWLVRSLIARSRDRALFAETKRRMRTQGGARLYLRFRPVDRFCHLLIIVSFLLLVATGMPLKFHREAWAVAFFQVLGGPQVAAALHRLGAVLTFGYFALHLVSLAPVIRNSRDRFRDPTGRFSLRRFFAFLLGPDSPLPNLDDLKDLSAHLRWFFGRGPQPTFDRFTYWEKFDYMAVFWGVSIIGWSGLVMWSAQWVTRWLPGWVINLALVIHSDEALLAAGFIFVFHFFHNHFRPEKFPMDTVMFSGRVTEAEMLHERGRQVARLEIEGRLQSLEHQDDWNEWRRFFQVFGTVAVFFGFALAAVIFWAMARQMFGG